MGNQLQHRLFVQTVDLNPIIDVLELTKIKLSWRNQGAQRRNQICIFARHNAARLVRLQVEIFYHQRRFAADADKPLLLPVNICFRHRRVGKPERVAKRSLRARTRLAEHQAV